MGLSTFNKTGYKSSEKIVSQYDRKIKLLLQGRNESELNKQELDILSLLHSLKELDPRHKEVAFGLEEEVAIGIAIADKLDAMTDEEFMVSSYPYEWINELKQKTVCRVTNKEAIDMIEDLYKEQDSLFGENNVNPQVQQRKRRMQQIIDQYEKRIVVLLNGRQKEQLSGEDKKNYDILVRASMYDPRRPDVGFGSKEMVDKGFEIGARLDSMSEEQFLTDSYVIEWIDIIGEGMRINNMPIDN